MYKVVGYYLYIHINRWFHISDVTAPWHLQAVSVSIYTARIVIHVENQPTYSK